MANQDMLVNYVRGEECRIAIVEDGKLEEFYSERASADLHVGNIYRGKVTNTEPSFQAAFVDFGLERSGFLHVTDVHPRYFPGEKHDDVERVGHKTPRRDRPPIQACFRRGQDILVQVLKEGIGSKGPTLTSYLSIPGRFLVMMPHMERHGVSRKIEDPEKRRQIHEILDELNPPEGFGFIVRTAGLDRPKTELKRDLAYLLRLWKDIEHHMKTGHGPAELYVESDLITRTLRDVITPDVKRIIIDDRDTAIRAKQFLRLATPRSTTKVIHYNQPLPLFDAFDVERQIKGIYDRVVPLESGGSLVFDTTEAIVAIDVNSGKFRDHSDAETTAYKINMEAVDEIARQLRLRDLGGIIVLDLIDMYQAKHRREVEKRFRENLKKDRARTKDLHISELGLIEMTRQRMRPSLKKSAFRECPTCSGAGLLLSLESIVLEVMRKLGVALHTSSVVSVELSASAEVLAALLNRRKEALAHMEQSSGKRITFAIDPAAGPDTAKITGFNDRNNPVDMANVPKGASPQLTEADEISLQDVKELDDLVEAEEFEAEPEQPTSVAEPTAEEDGSVATLPTLEAPTRSAQPVEEGQAGTGGRRRRRRRRRGRGGRGSGPDGSGPPAQIPPAPPAPSGYESATDTVEAAPFDESAELGNERLTEDQTSDSSAPPQGDATTDTIGAPQGGGRRRRRRRGGRRHRRGRGRGPGTDQPSHADSGGPPPESSPPPHTDTGYNS